MNRDPIRLWGGSNFYQLSSNITEYINPLGLLRSSQTGGLNWDWNGDRQAHVIDNHSSVNPNKPKQSIFKQKPVPTVNKARY